MDDEERREHAEMCAGDVLNALDDLECLWSYHGLPGVSKELYDERLAVYGEVMRIIATHMETGDLVGLLRAFGETLYERFKMDPENGELGYEKHG